MSDEIELRTLLWLRHGCPNAALYGDDGEMQCNKCGIDFKRDSVDDIEFKLSNPEMRAFLLAVREHKGDVQ